jgi:hypothetical protein
MKVAICFYGFLRELYSSELVKNYLNNILYNNIELIDIYYACPNKLSELSNELNEEEKINVTHTLNSINVNYEIYDYNPNIFIEDIHKNNINLYSNITNQISPRLLSMFYGIKKSVELLQKSTINYDRVIVTRFDLLNSIQNINKNNNYIDDSIYILRTSPYRVNFGRFVNNFHAEDRIFFGSKNIILKLTNIYDFIKSNWDDNNAYAEKLLYDFYKNENIEIKYNEDYILETVLKYKQINNEYTDYYNKMYNNFIGSINNI